jgi:hypothetical protein
MILNSLVPTNIFIDFETDEYNVIFIGFEIDEYNVIFLGWVREPTNIGVVPFDLDQHPIFVNFAMCIRRLTNEYMGSLPAALPQLPKHTLLSFARRLSLDRLHTPRHTGPDHHRSAATSPPSARPGAASSVRPGTASSGLARRRLPATPARSASKVIFLNCLVF